MRVGEACVLALGVSTFAAVPTALRTARAGGSFFEGLLVGAAVLLPLVAVGLALFRAAGRGLRGVLGASPVRVASLRVALWIGLSVPLLAVLGTLLKVGTNHRGLGGATFGVLGLGAVTFAAIATHRIVSAGQSLAERGVKPWLLAAIGTAVCVLPLFAAAAPLARLTGADRNVLSVQAAIIDGAIALVATALLASVDLGASLGRVAGTLGVPLAAVVMIAATARIESSPSLGRAVRAGGGLAASLLGALEGWTDRDQDGMGAHFGGADCDEGDPARHPGAAELPGDGVDQDCDGADPPRAASADNLPSRAPGEVIPANATAKAPPPPSNAATAPHPAAAPAPPGAVGNLDIILVTLDTVRADHTSAYGYKRPTTPSLADLAARGVLFEKAYATGGDTQRALAPLVTGRRFSQSARDRREWPTFLPENDTLAERLKRAGYITAAVTSFTWLSEERGFAQGFDRFETVYDDAHPEREVTGKHAITAALSILKELESRAQPIFLWVHLFDAHEKYLEHPGIDFGKGSVARYDGEIAFVDAQLAALREAVEKGPRASKTAWIVHGSHGEGFAEHDFTGHGAELYEEVLRVPLVIAVPGQKPGRYDKGVVSTLDIAPTVLALGNAPADGVDGESLGVIVKGDLGRAHGPVYARAARRAAIIDWPLKLMIIQRKRSDRLLLFNLAADPGETKDLSGEHPDDLARLTEKRAAFEPPEK